MFWRPYCQLDIFEYCSTVYWVVSKAIVSTTIQVVDNHDLVLKPMVTWGTPFRKPQMQDRMPE